MILYFVVKQSDIDDKTEPFKGSNNQRNQFKQSRKHVFSSSYFPFHVLKRYLVCSILQNVFTQRDMTSVYSDKGLTLETSATHQIDTRSHRRKTSSADLGEGPDGPRPPLLLEYL